MALKSDPSHWTDIRHLRGLEGERIAEWFLRLRGWVVLAHRYRLGRAEIDLIVRRGRTVAFVEVKTRFGTSFGSPLEAVTWHKQREIVRVAQGWVDRFGEVGAEYRFDVIGVTMTSGGPVVQHVKDAFRAGWR